MGFIFIKRFRGGGVFTGKVVKLLGNGVSACVNVATELVMHTLSSNWRIILNSKCLGEMTLIAKLMKMIAVMKMKIIMTTMMMTAMTLIMEAGSV